MCLLPSLPPPSPPCLWHVHASQQRSGWGVAGVYKLIDKNLGASNYIFIWAPFVAVVELVPWAVAKPNPQNSKQYNRNRPTRGFQLLEIASRELVIKIYAIGGQRL